MQSVHKRHFALGDHSTVAGRLRNPSQRIGWRAPGNYDSVDSLASNVRSEGSSVLQDHFRDSLIPLSCINEPSKVIGINPSNTLGLRPHPRVWSRFDNTPHLLGKAFDDHGSEVETSHSLWMWSIRSRPGIGETDRPCRQETHLLQTVHQLWY